MPTSRPARDDRGVERVGQPAGSAPAPAGGRSGPGGPRRRRRGRSAGRRASAGPRTAGPAELGAAEVDAGERPGPGRPGAIGRSSSSRDPSPGPCLGLPLGGDRLGSLGPNWSPDRDRTGRVVGPGGRARRGRAGLKRGPRPPGPGAGSLDRLQVGQQAGLLVLFDGSPAPRQPPTLEIGPGTGGDEEWADRPEAEGIPLILIFEVGAAELSLDLGASGRRPRRRGGRGSSTRRW